MTARLRSRMLVAILVILVLGLFAGANVHLLWVGFSSQPTCVPHLKSPGEQGRFRAAQPSC